MTGPIEVAAPPPPRWEAATWDVPQCPGAIAALVLVRPGRPMLAAYVEYTPNGPMLYYLRGMTPFQPMPGNVAAWLLAEYARIAATWETHTDVSTPSDPWVPPKLTAQWVPDDDGIGKAADVIQGGTSDAPSWEEYAREWTDSRVPEALRTCVLATGLAKAKGDETNDGHFLLSSAGQHRRLTFTQRAWADLVQAIADKREGYLAYFTRGAR